MSPEEKDLLRELDRTSRESTEIRNLPPDYKERLGATIGDLDWNAERVLIKREVSSLGWRQSEFEKFIRQNFERGDHIAVGHMERPAGERPIMHQSILPVEQVVDDRYQRFLRAMNVQGHDIHVSLNTFEPGGGRHKSEIRDIRHLGLDLDNGGRQALDRIFDSGVPPHHAFETSPGKYQAWWQVHGLELQQAEAATRGLIRTFGGDPAASDAARVFRAPGFTNRKPAYADLERPHWVREVRSTDAGEYTPAVFGRYMELGHERLRTPSQPRASGGEGRKLTQSERDWADVRQELKQGRAPEIVMQDLAARRSDKPDPGYYAERTVERARQTIEREHRR